MWPIQPLCVATMENSIIKPQAPQIGKSLRGFVPMKQQLSTFNITVFTFFRLESCLKVTYISYLLNADRIQKAIDLERFAIRLLCPFLVSVFYFILEVFGREIITIPCSYVQLIKVLFRLINIDKFKFVLTIDRVHVILCNQTESTINHPHLHLKVKIIYQFVEPLLCISYILTSFLCLSVWVKIEKCVNLYLDVSMSVCFLPRSPVINCHNGSNCFK